MADIEASISKVNVDVTISANSDVNLEAAIPTNIEASISQTTIEAILPSHQVDVALTVIGGAFNGTGYATQAGTLAQFAATTSSQLAGVISDETGTGALVFNTSPTFGTKITTPAVYGSAAANGSLVLEGTLHATKDTSYVILQPTAGNVGIGTSTPADKLSLYGVGGAIGLGITNNSTTGASYIFLSDGSANGFLELDYTGSAYSDDSSLVDINNGFYFRTGSTSTGGFSMIVQANAPMRFATGGFALTNVRMWVNGTGEVGINTNSPQARLHVNAAAVGVEAFRISTTATNDDPMVRIYQNRLATTDATVTNIQTFTIPASTTVTILALAVARRTGGVAGTAEDGAAYMVAATFKNVAGSAVQIGTTTNLVTHESQAGWDLTFDVSAATARLRATGATNNNVTWHVPWFQVMPVSS